jgi:hypothetical protein
MMSDPEINHSLAQQEINGVSHQQELLRRRKHTNKQSGKSSYRRADAINTKLLSIGLEIQEQSKRLENDVVGPATNDIKNSYLLWRWTGRIIPNAEMLKCSTIYAMPSAPHDTLLVPTLSSSHHDMEAMQQRVSGVPIAKWKWGKS